MDNLIGRKLDGRYEIIQQVGAGGMANVYKALDVADGKTVAVKVLRDEFVNNEEFLRRFKNESKAIALLSHPNIVKVFDVNFSDATQYIVMEYIDGITLMRYLEHKKKLGWKDALYFTVQVLRALQHAHDRGIVHRDIKPQNIMLLKDGTIKVMDFGIARFSRSQTRTITDKAIGSVHYISPEQAKGDDTDAKSDIYSLGVMLYEMLTGTLPFESDSAVSVALLQISGKPKGLREIDPEIPEALEDITLKAMAKDPADRYTSASQMLRDIEEFKNNPSIKFEYKYLNTEDPKTKYEKIVTQNAVPAEVETVHTKKNAAKASGGTQKRRKNVGIPILMGITLACFIGAVVFAFMLFSTSPNSIFTKHTVVSVPSFVGMTVEEAEKSAANAHFKFEVVEEYNTEYPLGQIFDQDPIASREVNDDITVTLYVSKGIEYVIIPDVKGMAYSTACDTLADMHLVITVETVSTNAVSVNQCLKSSPAANTEVEAWSVVTLYVRLAEQSATTYVPSIIGLTTQRATILLSVHSLKAGSVTYEYNEEVERGHVISQSIEVNTRVSQGSTVDYVVSLGPTPNDLELTLTGNGPFAYELAYKTDVYASADYVSTPIVVNGAREQSAVITLFNGDLTATGTITINFDSEDQKQTIDVSEFIPPEWLQHTITVRYLEDGTNTVLRTPYTQTLNGGTAYDVSSQTNPTISGYTRKSVSGSVTGTLTADVTITVWYEQTVVPPTQYTVTVNYYLNETTTPLHEAYTATLDEGSAYDVTAQTEITIEGYTKASVSGTVSGTLSGNVTVDVFYTQNPT